jgi:hypothetical protein
VVDHTPYIIVNNQKISPIEWSPRSDWPTAEQKGREAHPFGVVDRVTISAEAHEKSRSHAAQATYASPFPEDPSIRPRVAAIPLLAYSPKRPR